MGYLCTYTVNFTGCVATSKVVIHMRPKMKSRTLGIVYIVLILCKEFHLTPIAIPGPSSGILLQDTAGFILTDKRMLIQKINISLDPRIAIEKYGLEKCHVTKDKAENTVNAVLVHDKWLVSTPLQNMTVFYKDQVMMKVISLSSPMSLIKVPQNSRIVIGDRTLYPVNIEDVEGEVETVDMFQGQDIPINPDLKFPLDHKPNHTIKMVIRKGNVTVDALQYTPVDEAILYPSLLIWRPEYLWGTLYTVILGWLMFLTVKMMCWIQVARPIISQMWFEHGRLNPADQL